MVIDQPRKGVHLPSGHPPHTHTQSASRREQSLLYKLHVVNSSRWHRPLNIVKAFYGLTIPPSLWVLHSSFLKESVTKPCKLIAWVLLKASLMGKQCVHQRVMVSIFIKCHFPGWNQRKPPSGPSGPDSSSFWKILNYIKL